MIGKKKRLFLGFIKLFYFSNKVYLDTKINLFCFFSLVNKIFMNDFMIFLYDSFN